eukprot:15369324-Alexandrium_andersonii.AAC.1
MEPTSAPPPPRPSPTTPTPPLQRHLHTQTAHNNNATMHARNIGALPRAVADVHPQATQNAPVTPT